MTGEMVAIDPVTGEEPDGTIWHLHAAIAAAVGGTVQPFDQYQGPYVAVGPDIRIGTGPYAYAPRGLGVCRLWLTGDEVPHIWREDTETESGPIFDEEDAAREARRIMRGGARGEIKP